MLRALFAFALLMVGCGDGSQMPAPPDMARGPMDHPALWHIKYGGGPTQPAPEVYTVVWQGQETFGARLGDFVDWMLKSDYWKGALAEYGIGAGAGKGVIVIPAPPPATIADAQLQDLAKMLVMSGQATNSANMQLAFVPSPTTTVVTADGNGCDLFAGYHGHASLGTGNNIIYSVNLQCDGEDGEPFDQATKVLSHEIAEAATDSLPPTGYVAEGPIAQEVSDLCNFGAGMPIDVPADATHPARRYWVQRQYSGQVALDGTKDPCLPVPWERPYWNVALDPAVIPVASSNTKLQVNARLAVFAYGDVGLIKWFALSSDGIVSPSQGEAHAGDTIPVTITLFNAARGVHEFDVLAQSEKAGSAAWFSYITAQ